MEKVRVGLGCDGLEMGKGERGDIDEWMNECMNEKDWGAGGGMATPHFRVFVVRKAWRGMAMMYLEHETRSYRAAGLGASAPFVIA